MVTEGLGTMLRHCPEKTDDMGDRIGMTDGVTR